jgi:hypothetical protein
MKNRSNVYDSNRDINVKTINETVLRNGFRSRNRNTTTKINFIDVKA